MTAALEVNNLTTHIQLSRSVVQAVGNVDLAIDAGETLGLVGESGCGKSMLGLSILGLLPNGGHIVEGSIKLGGRELVGLRDAELRKLRGNEVAMIFQDSLSSLNPTKTIGEQVAEPVRLHRGAIEGGGARPRARGARPRRPAAAAGAPGRLPAPALRRPAPAGDDRDRAGLRAEGADRRRADHRARRDDPGADPAAARRPQAAARHGDAADHPRHGRRRRPRRPDQRHVRRADRRDRDRPTSCSRACATPTPRRCSARSRGSTRTTPRRCSASPGSRRT